MMKIAVLGSTGVLGRAIIPLLVQQGYEVRAFARSAEKAKSIFPNNVQIVECDRCRETAARWGIGLPAFVALQ